PPRSTLFPYTTLFRSLNARAAIDLVKSDHEMRQNNPPLHPLINMGQVSSTNPHASFTFDSTGSEDVKATLVWDDPPSSQIPTAKDRKSTRLNSSHVSI